MIVWEIFALISLILAGSLAFATVWSRKETWMRGVAVCAFILSFPAIVGVGLLSLSHPGPYTMAQITAAGEYRVLGLKMMQDVAIYVYLDVSGGAPRSYALPWDNDQANKLQDLMDRQREGKGGFMIKIPPFDRSLDIHPPEFHPMPQPKRIPDKPIQEKAPPRYERSA